MPEPKYTWNTQTRQFRNDATGRYASRTEIRTSVDFYVDRVRDDIKRISESLRDGKINLPQWQIDMESVIKRAHTASGAIGSGGWKQAKQSDWGYIGSRLRQEYGFLRNFALEIEQGLPLDGRFIGRAQQYGRAATQTYEAQLRRIDLASQPMEERRILHAQHSCADCQRYAAQGWQPGGTLPNTGEACACRSQCLCSFERRPVRRAA
jgi:hypothetical protein